MTKDSAGSDKKYYQGLAQEMFLILDTPVAFAFCLFAFKLYSRMPDCHLYNINETENLLNAHNKTQPTQLVVVLRLPCFYFTPTVKIHFVSFKSFDKNYI